MSYPTMKNGALKKALVALTASCFSLSAFADTVVEPLISTTWNQSGGYNPNFTYNNKTPLFENKRAHVGCIAVAFGQVLKHFDYPKKGIGNNTYCNSGGSVYGCSDLVEVDFFLERYNWSAMTSNLNYASSDENVEAISTLLYHIGASVSVTYGKDGSAAKLANPSIISDFRRHFNLPNIETAYRSDFGNEGWYELITNEIRNGRPVVLVGFDSNAGAGHAYIIDGINEEGKVHVNWGWGGSRNGYYDLNNLELDFGRDVYSFTEDLFALVNFTPYVQPEGSTCNDSYGSRCAAGLECVDTNTNEIIDYLNSETYGTCTVVDFTDTDNTDNSDPTDETEVVIAEVVTEEAGIVESREWLHFGPYSTLETIQVVMTGDNDADLYVRKGSQPTSSSYNCRPYRAHSNETCNLEGEGEYYVSINGYETSSFSVTVTTQEEVLSE
ncbi:C10 family peptidase [Pleionea sediminis]|uniref:C10 family peptidase n=1 Tax=Pleionea sediminis TaxID=2569479 RepID=UPI00118631B3|nr:C10 family peptidase [Pleionea sediminis]